MKIIFKSAAVAFIALLSLASCNKEEIFKEMEEVVQEGKIAVKTEVTVDGVDVTNTRAATEAGYTTGDGVYHKTDPVTVAAHANDGYELVRFYDKGGNPDQQNSSMYKFDAIKNQTFKAEFKKAVNYTLTVTASPAEGGTVTGGGSFKSGASCTVTAAPNSGYTFDGWYEGSTKVSSNSSYSFTISSNRTMTAKFVKEIISVNVDLKWRVDVNSGSNFSYSYKYVIFNSDLGNRISLRFYGTTSNTTTRDDEITYPLTVLSNTEECYCYFYSELIDYDGNSIGRDGRVSSFDLLIDNEVILSKLQPETALFEFSFLNGKKYAAGNYLINFTVSRTK